MVNSEGRACQGPPWQHQQGSYPATQRVLERKYGGDKSAVRVPTIDYLAVQSKAVPETLPSVTRTEVGNLVTFKFGSKLPEFCAVAGNHGESFKVARNDNVQALTRMDFAIQVVTCWKVISIPSLHNLSLHFLFHHENYLFS
jgi:hypothetical protein